MDAMSKEDRINMFEFVNHKFLKLKGEERKKLRKAVLTWKKNKSVGCLELLTHLYQSEDIHDSETEWFKEYVNDPENDLSKETVLSQKPITYLIHKKRMTRKDDDIEKLEAELDLAEEKLENVLEDNKLMKIAEHKNILNEIKASYKEDQLLAQTQINKLSLEIELYESKLSKKDKQNQHLQKTIDDLQKKPVV